jgi:hypothetical protein
LNARDAERRKSGCGGTFIEIVAARKKNSSRRSAQMRSNIHALMQDANDCDRRCGLTIDDEVGAATDHKVAVSYPGGRTAEISAC